MSKQSDEQSIRSKARRRLIGAIALAMAVVVILPMVLDSEPKVSGQDIDLRIPAADKVTEFVPSVALSEVVEAAAESAVPASGVVETVTPVEAPVASGQKTEIQSAPAKIVASKTIEKPADKPADKPVEVKKSDPSTDIKVPETKAAELKPADHAVIAYTVQVAAFAKAETATQEAEKLRGWGYKAYTQLIGGTTRVRVGPYAERDKAETVRQMLEKHGLHPAIKTVEHGKQP